RPGVRGGACARTRAGAAVAPTEGSSHDDQQDDAAGDAERDLQSAATLPWRLRLVGRPGRLLVGAARRRLPWPLLGRVSGWLLVPHRAWGGRLVIKAFRRCLIVPATRSGWL